MKKNILLLIYIVLTYSCTGQKLLIEDQIINCQNSIYQESNFDLKKTITDYENLLVENKLLNDKSGKSYITLLNRIIADENFQIDSLISFYDIYPWFKISKSTQSKIRACGNSQDKNPTKWNRIRQNMDAIKTGERQPTLIYKILLDNLNESDFELEFYKLKTFLVLEMMNSKHGVGKLLPPINSDDN